MMKNYFFLNIFLIAVLTFKGQNNEAISVNTPVKSVILYLDGAEVTQNKLINLNAGRTLITFTGLSPKLISKSVQVNIGSDVVVLSVSDKINFLSEQIETTRVKQLKDSIEIYSDQNRLLNLELDAYEQEKGLLSKNESIGGHDKGVNIADLKLAADYYRTRLKDINSETFKVEKKIEKVSAMLAKLQKQLTEQNGNGKLPTAEVSILVSSTTKVSATIDLKYVVKECGWVPSYDLITEDINKPIELKYRAKVYNNSGVDWNDVKLKISSADPMKNASKPDLQPWYLNFSTLNNTNLYGKVAINNDQYQLNNMNIAQSQTLYDVEVNEKAIKGKKQELPKTYDEIQVSELSAEFDIKQSYSVPSDAKPYLVDVTSYNLNATFQYYSVPKVEKEAFMLARIAGWEDLDLIEGNANVYFGGTYVGQSHIDTRTVADTLDLSFGRDKKIVVTRTKLKDNTNDKLTGTNRKITYTYEIVVKNNHKSPVQIEIEDQLPVSQNSEIIVDILELSKAERNELTGQLKWKLSLAPDESKKIILSFSVKYPKNKSVELKKKARTVSAPSF